MSGFKMTIPKDKPDGRFVAVHEDHKGREFMSELPDPEVFVRIDPDITYGPCPECGAVEGQQCSTEWGSEMAGWVHALRQHWGAS